MRLAKWFGGMLLLMFLNTPTEAGQSISLAWNPSADANVTGYFVYYGAASQTYTNKLNAANLTSATITGLVEGTTYFFAVTAHDALGMESLPSNEVAYTVPLAPVNQPPTLDPLGGLTLGVNAGLQKVSLSGITSGAINQMQTLTVTTSSSDPGLIPAPLITYTSPATTGGMTIQPALNAKGSATITVTVNNGGASNNLTSQSFVVTVGLAAPPPTARLRLAAGRPAVLTMKGQVGHTYDILATQTFTNWTLVGTVTMGSTGSFDFTDPDSINFPARFYRLSEIASTTPTVQIRVAPTKQVVLTIKGQLGHTYEIQAMQASTNWTVIGTATLGRASSFDFADAASTNFPARYYRLRETK
jgi:hypothetical protein